MISRDEVREGMEKKGEKRTKGKAKKVDEEQETVVIYVPNHVTLNVHKQMMPWTHPKIPLCDCLEESLQYFISTSRPQWYQVDFEGIYSLFFDVILDSYGV